MKTAAVQNIRPLDFAKELNLRPSDTITIEPSIDITTFPGRKDKLTAKVDRPPSAINRLAIVEIGQDDELARLLGIRCGWAGVWAERDKTSIWSRTS